MEQFTVVSRRNEGVILDLSQMGDALAAEDQNLTLD